MNYSIINFNKNSCIFTTHYVKKQHTKFFNNCSIKVIPLPFFSYNKKLKKLKF